MTVSTVSSLPSLAELGSASGKLLPRAASGVSDTATSEQVTPDAEAVVQAMDDIKNSVQSIRRNLEFSLDDESGLTVVTVKDSESGEVIRQIPSEVLVKLAASFKEASSLLFSERV